jgi:Matrixin
MTCRRLAVLVVVVLLAMLTSCSSAKAREQHPAAPVSQPPGAPTDTCVAPAGLALQDQDRNDHQAPWKRNGAAKVVITFETKNVPPDWVAEMQKGVAAWNESPCLDTKLVQTCQPKTNCVTVSVVPESAMGSDGNFDAVESGGFTVRGHIDYSNSLTDGAKTNVAIHEMGHAVGLAHRKTEHVLMNGDTYDDVFYPDKIDFENLLVLYGNQK